MFYDGECRLCLNWANRLRATLSRRRFELLPLQARDTTDSALLGEMRLLLADGRNLGGADAVVEVARRIWWAWPLWALSRLPGMMPLLRSGYRILAANRHCADGVRLITHQAGLLDWLPLILLPVTALATWRFMSDWVFMWALAFALYLGCKWLTLRRDFPGCRRPHRGHAVAYLLLWPGMDATAFINRKPTLHPSLSDWAAAVAKSLLGLTLMWLAVAGTISLSPMLKAWVGMTGVVLLLHFGLFHLLALFWQVNGRNAKPLMRAPLLADSLADFWGNRWNTAFNVLAHDLVFRPLVRRIGMAGATMVTFLLSGIIHDLVISLPARGGYGLPTAYFVMQGLAVLFERSRTGRRLGLGHGVRGWLFVLLVTVAPVWWLFHPAFIHNVILPMLQALGTFWNTP